MNILMLSTNYATSQYPKLGGGSAAVAAEIARALSARGHRILIVRSEYPVGLVEIENSVEVRNGPRWNVFHWNELTKAPKIARMAWHLIEDRGWTSGMVSATLHELKPDLVATHNVVGFGTRVWRRADAMGAATVHTLHDYYLLCPRVTMLRYSRPCVRSCSSCSFFTAGRRSASGHLTSVISVSTEVLATHRREGLFHSREDSFVIHNAAPPFESARTQSIEGLVRVGFIGRGSFEKGLHILLGAFDLVAAPNLRLVIAGDIQPEMQPGLSDMRRAGDVELLGHVDRARFYNSVDVVVVPSTYAEPFSLAVVESLAHGLPVAASAIGGIPEALGDESSGWLLPPNDVQSLADLLMRIAEHPGELHKKAKSAVLRAKMWTFADMVDAYERVYEDAIRKRRALQMDDAS